MFTALYRRVHGQPTARRLAIFDPDGSGQGRLIKLWCHLLQLDANTDDFFTMKAPTAEEALRDFPLVLLMSANTHDTQSMNPPPPSQP